MKFLSELSILALAIGSMNGYATEPVQASYDNAYLKFKSDSGSFKLWLDGRIMLDTGFVSSDKNDFVEKTNIRRARLAFKTVFDNKWAGEFDIDFADHEPEIKDMWIAYIGLENFNFKIGNHKPFFSIAEMTTSRWYTFMETPMVTDASNPGRAMGLSASYFNDSFFGGVSIFGNELGVDNTEVEDDEGELVGVHIPYSYSGRFVYRPFVNADATQMFHVGLNHMDWKPQSDGESKMRLRVRPESKVLDYELINTGKVKRVASQRSISLEIAARYNKFMLQAEYLENTFIRNDIDDEDVDTSGYYVDASYMIWGEGRPYNLSDAEFGPVRPTTEHGGLELAIRYSSVDFNDADADVFGGSSDNITIGLNWYAHSNVVFRLNHTRASLDEFADGDGDFVGGDDVTITGLRIEYLF
ncbi:OprO/OprP family phosphate-selective porin [Marinagarivorans algicola]|uniref:OprO/OprP family phosphate-selective porin n=1 Tax=Marinagarivorans algicola TaxID=1513270 RepID=UPI0006B4A1F4|nr:porin [Marinagarivorans algicola]